MITDGVSGHDPERIVWFRLVFAKQEAFSYFPIGLQGNMGQDAQLGVKRPVTISLSCNCLEATFSALFNTQCVGSTLAKNDVPAISR